MNIMNKLGVKLGLLALLACQAMASAQEDGGGIGIGVGVGVGVGSGVGANIDVERVPGNVVQGRRIFAAKVVTGFSSVTNVQVGTPGSGVSGIPRGWGSGFSHYGTIERRQYSTTVSVFNPGTNTVTVTVRATGGALVSPSTLTLAPISSQQIPAGTPTMPLGAAAMGFMVLESTAPLEVVALYQYRDERVDYQSDTWIETAAGALFGPGF